MAETLDEIVTMIYALAIKESIYSIAELSEVTHFVTDFFCSPHNERGNSLKVGEQLNTFDMKRNYINS